MTARSARSALSAAVAVVVLSLVPAGGTAASSGPAAWTAAAVSISIGDDFYRPEKKTVKPRTTVTWTNNGESDHNATAYNGSFKTRRLDPGESRSITFRQLGRYRYYCTIHPWMTGVIKVCKVKNGVRVCQQSS